MLSKDNNSDLAQLGGPNKKISSKTILKKSSHFAKDVILLW